MQNLKAILDLSERAGATRYYQTPAFGSVANTGSGLSTPQPIRFTRSGFVTALYGQVQSGTVADYAGTFLRVQLGGTEDLFVDGQGGPAFAPFLGLFGGVQNSQRLLRRVEPGDLWVFTVQNLTSGSVTPLALCSFLDDADVAAVLAQLKKAA